MKVIGSADWGFGDVRKVKNGVSLCVGEIFIGIVAGNVTVVEIGVFLMYGMD